MATVEDYKGNEYVFSNGTSHVEIEYDFAKDGGATGVLDLIKVKEAMVLEQAYVKVKTTCTSGGSATVIIGVNGGDTDAILDATSGAVANLTAGAVLPGETASVHLKLAADAVIGMTIGTAALTAGKFVVVLKLAQF
ncbi:hypothetical protein EKK58_08575 [Candidatus Dependentiae bacterium]|nr:MAG: hypothetical protein EKK58_08575 [Candidatus Dependentiae bacterium]